MSEQIAACIDSLERFIERRLPKETHRELLSRGGWDSQLMAELNQLGWSVITRPEDRDGLGLPLSSLYRLVELLGRHLVPGPLAEQLVLPALLSTPADAVVAFADPEVTQDWLRHIGAFNITDNHLQGTVELVRFGKQATHLLCVATRQESTQRSPTLVLIPAEHPDVTVTDLSSSDPTAHYARVTIRRRTLSADEIVADGSAAVALVSQMRSWLRIYASCELSGIAHRVLADTVGYIGQRRQFGRPIGSFQAVKHLVAGMAQGAISLEAFCRAVMSDADTQSPKELEVAAWSLKAYAASTARKVCEAGLQAHGGIGFTVEYDLHWFLRRALALRTWYGDEQELNRLVGLRCLSHARSTA